MIDRTRIVKGVGKAGVSLKGFVIVVQGLVCVSLFQGRVALQQKALQACFLAFATDNCNGSNQEYGNFWHFDGFAQPWYAGKDNANLRVGGLFIRESLSFFVPPK
jgi:hypothetical protein